MKTRVVIGVLLTLLLAITSAVFNITPVTAQFPVHNVTQNLHYNTLHEAIEDPNISPGDTIHVDQGYDVSEHVWIEVASLRIIGQDTDTTIIRSDSPYINAIQVTADNVSICGFTIRDASGNGGRGIAIHGQNVEIWHNKITNCRWGLAIYARNNIIACNEIFANTERGIFVGSGANIIRGNDIHDNPTGIYLYSGSDNEIYYNNFVGNTYHVGYDIPDLQIWDDGGTTYPLQKGNYWFPNQSPDHGPQINGNSQRDNHPFVNSVTFNEADMNWDQRVNVVEEAIFIRAYLEGYSWCILWWDPRADLDHDDEIDYDDDRILGRNWGYKDP